MAKTTWDVWVVLANDPSQTIAYVPRWKSIQFSDQLNDVGSATLEHDFSDPFFDAFQTDRGDSLLEGPYALQIRRDGTAVFTFFIEDVQVDRAGVGQPLTIGGRGIASSLEWGIVLPEDFSNQARATAGTTQRPKFFDRLFPGYAYNVRVATTGNLSATYTDGPQTDVPGAGARLTATSNGSINNSGIDGVQDLVVGDTVLVKDQTTAAQNGVYWIAAIGSASTPWVLQRTARADGSPISDLEVDNAAFINEGTTNGYTSWSISSNGSLSNSNQVGTNDIDWTQVSVGSFTGISAFYILFKEADTGYEYSTKKADFGTVKTLYGRGGTGYAVDWPLSLDSTLNTALGKTDSKGHVVQDGGNFNIAVGRTLLDVLNEVASNTGVDWHVSATGVISIAVRPFVTDTVVFDEPFGSDLTTGANSLLFSLPMLETVETRTSVSELRTVVYGSDGFNLDRQISDRTGTYGFREMFIENTSDDAPAVANITASAVRQVRDGKLQITTSFAERDGMIAWQDFDIGDKVLVEIDTGTFSERIVSAIGASVDENGNETVEVTFGDVFQDIASNLKYAANYGRLGAAEIPTFTLRGTSSKPSAPTGTSVGAEVQGFSNRVVVGWEPADNTSAAQYEAVVYREEQDSAGIAVTYGIVDIYRDGNIAYVEVDASTGFSVGDWINIYDTTDGYFDRTNVFVTSVNGVYFTFDDTGPDIATGTYSAGDVVRIVERHSSTVPSNQTSATFENLAAPGRDYNFIVVPYTVTGQSGLPSPPFEFTASADAQIVLNGAIRSNNYVANTSGWTIEADGNAELNQVTIRNGAWVQGTLTAPTLQTATSNPRVIVNSGGLFAYDNTGTVVTSIDSTTGALFSSSANISGTITANALVAGASITSPVITGGTIDIGGADSTSFHVDSSGNMWMGNASYASAPFRVSSTGAIVATDATMTGEVNATSGTIGDLEISGGAVEYNDSGTSSYLRLGPQTWPTNDGSASLVISSSYGGGNYSRMMPSEVRTTGSMYATAFVGDFGRMDDYRNSSGGNATFYGTLVGNADTASLATTASNSDKLDGYYLSFSDVANTVATRRSDTSIQASYFVMTGGVTGSGSTIIKRSDGYILVQSSKRALKTNIENIDNSLDIIDLLQPRKFNWIPQADDPDDIFHNQIKYVHKTYGFVVEEVSDVSPELLEYSISNNELDAHYWKPHDFIALCVQGIKDLKSYVGSLETRISALESQP